MAAGWGWAAAMNFCRTPVAKNRRRAKSLPGNGKAPDCSHEMR